MTRWWPLVLALVAGAAAVLSQRATSDALLQDSDTRVLLAQIAARADPLSWFAGDWPLGNHFYRPVSTLAFEMDAALYGRRPAGFGLTNALIACAALAMLGWLAAEATRHPWRAAGAAALFAAWHLDAGPEIASALRWLWIPVLALALLRARSLAAVAFGIGATLAVVWLVSELQGPSQLHHRVVAWLPGRTASTMAVFALAALAAWIRFERLRRWDVAPPYDPLDPPEGRNSPAPRAPRGVAWWAVLALLASALALGCYEQAIMLPFLMAGVSALMARRGGTLPWGWLSGAFCLLAAYLALRMAIVPSDISEYQRQQFRFGPGVWLSLLDYAFPAGRGYTALAAASGLGAAVLFSPTVQQAAIGFVANATAYWRAMRARERALFAAWAGSLCAFAPMAWLKPFDHYHYFPMAIRAVFVVGLATVAFRLCLSAAGPPALQAPPRLGPAPGSPLRR